MEKGSGRPLLHKEGGASRPCSTRGVPFSYKRVCADSNRSLLREVQGLSQKGRTFFLAAHLRKIKKGKGYSWLRVLGKQLLQRKSSAEE